MTLLAQKQIDGGRLEFHQLTSTDPASINDGATGTVVFTLTGISTSDYVASAVFTTDLLELTVEQIVITTNTITVTVANNTGGAVDAAAQTANFLIIIAS